MLNACGGLVSKQDAWKLLFSTHDLFLNGRVHVVTQQQQAVHLRPSLRSTRVQLLRFRRVELVAQVAGDGAAADVEQTEDAVSVTLKKSSDRSINRFLKH